MLRPWISGFSRPFVTGKWPVVHSGSADSASNSILRVNLNDMKVLSHLFIALFVLSLFSQACTSPDQAQEAIMPVMDTVITEIRDTIITFYPETYEEVLQIVTSYDTVIVPREPGAE